MSSKTANLQITALHEIYFPVADLAAAEDWYTRHFGLTLVSREDKKATLRLAEGSLLTLVESELRNRFDSAPINFKAHDARKAHDQLDKNAIRAQEPESFYHYVDFDVWDPDGNSFNIISEPAWPNTPNNYFRIDGVFIGVIDFDRLLPWYVDVLGADIEYAFTGPTASLPEARYRCFRGIPVNLVESPGSIVQHRICDFASSDAKADYDYLHAKGVRLSDFVENNGKKTFSFFDPEGRELGIVEFCV